VIAGEVQGSVLCARDVSEIRHLEEQSRQAQKEESIGRLAGGVAHDLNNLLTPVIGYSEMVLDELAPEDRRREAVDQILKAGFRARNLVRQLLAFSRKQTLEYKPVDMNLAVAGFHKLLHRTIRESITIEIEAADRLQPVMADLGQIEQVILNLAINAQDAMPHGGQLSISTGLEDVKLSSPTHYGEIEPGLYVKLTISDTGAGMDPETRSHLFEPFYSTKGEQGTGLGLATVFGIIRQHGGHILVESEPGQGSTFKIYLPVSDGSPVPEDADRNVPKELKGFESILLVEDSEQVRTLALRILQRQGYTVFSAENGDEACELMASYGGTVHLLLTDVVMPTMNGRELFETLSAKQPRLKVLYMSGYSDDVIATQGIMEPGVPYLQKPFTVHGLATLVRQVLDQ